MTNNTYVYTLDLNDINQFPDINHPPVRSSRSGKSWYILTEIKENQSLNRPIYLVEDKLPGHFYVVAFYTEYPWVDARECKVGSIICIENGMLVRFVDGRVGYRIEGPEDVTILPCSMQKLKAINESLRQRYCDGLLSACLKCNRKGKTMGCAKCTTRYCSRDCQTQDWENHKAICKVLKRLHIWNRTEHNSSLLQV